jgi:DNA processing protein
MMTTPTAGDTRHELIATVALLQGDLLPKAHLAGVMEAVGSAVTLLRSLHEAKAGAEGQSGLFEAIPEAVWQRASREVESWAGAPFQAFTALDEGYPQLLRSIHNRPPLLFVEGAPITFLHQAVAIVGTRQATEAGLKRARRLARVFGQEGFAVVSGLAKGVDTAAHESALKHGARTIAVVGTGLRRTYPPENTELARRIVESGGSLVSQFLPDQPPAQWSFPMRNITMSGLSAATIVVEASHTSGARQQAGQALLHGRVVFLLRSLVESHEWARKMVEEGQHGTKALILEDASIALRRFSPGERPASFAMA